MHTRPPERPFPALVAAPAQPPVFARRRNRQAAALPQLWDSDGTGRPDHPAATAAPASLISITADAGVGTATFAVGAAAATSGTNGGNEHAAGSVLDPDRSSRACRRHPNTCWGQTCQRRAISDTRAPGSKVSAMIRAFSSADQRRRRPGPVRISMRRKPAFASSLTSTITIARSPSLRAQPAHSQLK